MRCTKKPTMTTILANESTESNFKQLNSSVKHLLTYKHFSYLKPAYNPCDTYGMHTTYDPRGVWVNSCCHWHENHPVVTASIIQADMNHRFKPRLGKCLTP